MEERSEKNGLANDGTNKMNSHILEVDNIAHFFFFLDNLNDDEASV